MKLYVATEHMTLLETCSSFASEDLGGTIEICRSRKDAVAAVHNLIREQVECEYDGDDEHTPEDIDSEADEIFDQADGTLDGDQWTWDATNRACVWRIVEEEVETN